MKARTICPVGFSGDPKYPCTNTLTARAPGASPEWILLSGCHLGAAEAAWRTTFGQPRMLAASPVYTTGGRSKIEGKDSDVESTIPELNAVDWIVNRKRE